MGTVTKGRSRGGKGAKLWPIARLVHEVGSDLEIADIGVFGLLSYGPDPVDIVRRAASYVDRILRDEKPGDLPVQFPTKFEMVVNRKTTSINSGARGRGDRMRRRQPKLARSAGAVRPT